MVATDLHWVEALVRLNGDLVAASRGLAGAPASVGTLLRYPALADGSLGPPAAWVDTGLITPPAASVPAGLSTAFRATAVLATGATQDATASVTWASQAPAVATVAPTGVATGVTQGTAVVTAIDVGVGAAALLTVAPPVVVSVAVTPAAAEIEVGGTQAFRTIGTLSDGSSQDLTAGVTWSSQTPAVATVSTGAVATGVAPGTTGTVATRAGVPPATATLVVRPRPPTIFGPLTTGPRRRRGPRPAGRACRSS